MRFTVRRMMVVVLFVAVSLAIFSEGRRTWSWHQHNRKEQVCLTLAEMFETAAVETERWGRVKQAAQFAAKAKAHREEAASHATAKGRFRPANWSGDPLLKLLRLSMITKLWLSLTGIIATVGGVVTLLRYGTRCRISPASHRRPQP